VKYMIMMHAPYGTGQYQIGEWDPEDLRAHIAFMHELNEELNRAGEMVDGQGLAPPGEARLVRADRNGEPMVTDGPFVETREFLAGFWIVDVGGPERAFEIAGRVSMAPGPGGDPLHMEVEVRPVMEAPPTDG